MNFKRLLKPILVILAILILTLSVSAGDLFGTYDQRIKVTVDHTKIDADLSWFPVTVFLTSSQGEEVFSELTSDEDFDRIAFTSSDGETQLYADCELFDDSEQKAIYHVSKTGWTISSSTDTDIYLYYDKDAPHNTTYISKSGDAAAQSVWDSNFKAVYHMNDLDPTGTDELDDDFEDNNLTEYTAGSHWATASDQAYAGTYSAKASGGEDSWSDRQLQFTLSEPAKYIKYDFYWRCNDATGGKYYRIITNPLHLLEGGNTTNTNFSYYTSGGGHRNLPTNTSFVADTWYHIEVYHDTVNDFAMYWIDGNYKGKATDIETSDAITTVKFGNEDTSGEDSWFDDITVTVYDTPLYGIVDSTSNANHGTKKSVNEPVEATGKVGQGQDFDGSDDYIGFNGINIPNDSNFTFETILYPDAWVGDNPGVWRSGSDNQGTTFIIFQSDTGYPWIRINGTNVLKPSSGTSVSLDAWSNLSWVVVSESSATLYINGSSAQTDTHSIATASFDIYKLGYQYDVGQRIEGIYDEVRLSNTNRSAAWIAATYNSLWDTLLTYGSEETGSAEEATNVLFIFSNF